MKYNVEIEIDDKAIKDSGMEPGEYIRQEMGWLEDSGISLVDLTAKEETVDLPNVLKDMSPGEALEYLQYPETPEPVTYKGIPLEGLDKDVSMAHSHFIGTNEGIDYLTALLSRDKQALTPKQFEAMSALNSVAVMNYQICNGGLDQYYFNQCHKEREPFSESDVKLVSKDRQVEMLRELHAFGREVFPERTEDNEHLNRIIIDFEESSYTEPAEGWLFDEEEEDGLDAPYDFDDRYYEVNDYLETLIESYAQYLDKSIEKSLGELVKEAKAKAAEKNAERKNPPQQDFKGIDR